MALTGPVGERCSIWFEWISLQQGESNLLDCLSAPPAFSPRFNTRTTQSLYRIESTTTSRLPLRRVDFTGDDSKFHTPVIIPTAGRNWVRHLTSTSEESTLFVLTFLVLTRAILCYAYMQMRNTIKIPKTKRHVLTVKVQPSLHFTSLYLSPGAKLAHRASAI